MDELKTEKVLKNIAKNLKKYREQKNISQTEISLHLNMERKGYQKLEYCQNNDIKLSTIIKILNYYKKSFDELVE